MYVVLTKNDNNTWDAIRDVVVNDETMTSLDEAIASGFPLVGMNTTEYKSSAIKNAIWNGTSFSGGNTNPDALGDDDEKWTKINRYAFLCNNKIVLSFTLAKTDPLSAMHDAAFAGETILIKSDTEPLLKTGKTFTWDGTNLVLVSE